VTNVDRANSDLKGRRKPMEATKPPIDDTNSGPHFATEIEPEAQAWEEIEAGRFMPRRTRGSYRGRALG
jgi:hypothetical protein